MPKATTNPNATSVPPKPADNAEAKSVKGIFTSRPAKMADANRPITGCSLNTASMTIKAAIVSTRLINIHVELIASFLLLFLF